MIERVPANDCSGGIDRNALAADGCEGNRASGHFDRAVFRDRRNAAVERREPVVPDGRAGNDRAIRETGPFAVHIDQRQWSGSGLIGADRHDEVVVARDAERPEQRADCDGFADRKRAERCASRIHDRDGAVERGRAARERVLAVCQRAGDRERAGRRTLNDGKVVYQRSAARGRSRQVEIKDRAFIHRNDRAGFKRHPSGQFAAAGNTQIAVSGNAGIRRRAAGIDFQAAGILDNGIPRRTAGTDLQSAGEADNGVAGKAAGGNPEVADELFPTIGGDHNPLSGKSCMDSNASWIDKKTACGHGRVHIGLAVADGPAFVFEHDAAERNGLVDVRDRIIDDLGFVSGRVDRLEINRGIFGYRNAVHVCGPFPRLADAVQGSEQLHIVRERRGYRNILIGRSCDIRRNIGDRRCDGIPGFRHVDRHRQGRSCQIQREIPSIDGRFLADGKRPDLAPEGAHGDRPVEPVGSFRERIGVAAGVQGHVHGERDDRRSLNKGKVVHERFAARGRPGQVEVQNRCVGQENGRAAFEVHLSGQLAGIVDSGGAAGFDDYVTRRAAIDVDAAAGEDEGVIHYAAAGGIEIAASGRGAGYDAAVGRTADCAFVKHDIVRRSAAEDAEGGVDVDVCILRQTAAEDADVTEYADRGPVDQTAGGNLHEAEPADLRVVCCRPGMDRGGCIRQTESAERMRGKGRGRAVVDLHIGAVFGDLERGAAGKDMEISDSGSVTGKDGVLQLERDAVGRSLDVGVRRDFEIKSCAALCIDIRGSAAAGDMQIAALRDDGVVRHAAGKDMQMAFHGQCRTVRGRRGVNRGGRLGQDESCDRVRGKDR